MSILEPARIPVGSEASTARRSARPGGRAGAVGRAGVAAVAVCLACVSVAGRPVGHEHQSQGVLPGIADDAASHAGIPRWSAARGIGPAQAPDATAVVVPGTAALGVLAPGAVAPGAVALGTLGMGTLGTGTSAPATSPLGTVALTLDGANGVRQIAAGAPALIGASGFLDVTGNGGAAPHSSAAAPGAPTSSSPPSAPQIPVTTSMPPARPVPPSGTEGRPAPVGFAPRPVEAPQPAAGPVQKEKKPKKDKEAAPWRRAWAQGDAGRGDGSHSSHGSGRGGSRD